MFAPDRKKHNLPNSVAIFASLLITLIVVEAAVLIVLRQFTAETSPILRELAATFLMASISTPFLWVLIVMPFRSRTINEIHRQLTIQEYLPAPEKINNPQPESPGNQAPDTSIHSISGGDFPPPTESAAYQAEALSGDLREADSEAKGRSPRRLTIEKHLRRSIANGEMSLHYQPKVNLRSGLITGMEALARWQNPELGQISPKEFIPIAEETGFIDQIVEWSLRTACARSKAWQDAGLPPLGVAANLSAQQFKQPGLAGMISGILDETGLDPRFLELEITESVVMGDMDQALVILLKLKDMGIRLAMDDFGTGYSSLSYLKKFPFDKLKIDQSFVRDITSNPHNAAIARAVIAMAHGLRLKVIAEGVETIGQLEYLRSHGCDEMQGYYFSRPIPETEFANLILSGRRLTFEDIDAVREEKTILVVDDDRSVATALKRMFLLDGYSVLTASSAAEGFELLATNRIAVVLSDLRMPEMDGSEFLSRVRELYPETVRILISGQGDLDSVTHALNQGSIFQFLTKPWNDDHIRDRIADAFKHHGNRAYDYGNTEALNPAS
jgi:EAL domain-containing protein (putative c-di-GMP-specific phosphodiesterase class I)/ActR/RegA family two-component response regulator